MPRSPHFAARTIAVAIAVLLGAGILSAAHARADATTGTDTSTAVGPDRVVAAALPGPVRPVGATVPAYPGPEPTSTIAPSTPATTTPPPAPPTTASPVTAPPVTAPPITAAPTTVPAPAAEPAPTPEAAPQESTEARIQRAFGEGVPDAWRAGIPVRFEVIDGSVSWAHSGGVIQLGTSHTEGRYDHLVDVIAHEFAHLIAFRYGSQEYAGAGPAGWPAPEHRPEEAWADCTQQAFTGRQNPSHGLPACEPEALAWVADWLARGPDAHERTR